MCGLFGWQLKKKSGIPMVKREVMAGVLALNNSLRGDQSWGVVLRTGQGKTAILKEVGDIAEVTGATEWGHADQAMGHTRYSTHGKITKENCHPFRAGKILLSHNGVIFNHGSLNTKYNRKCEVDSEHFARHLDEGLPFDDIEAYGALEWMEDDQDGQVFLTRMSGGSLAVAKILDSAWRSAKQVGTAWSSTAAHLKDALNSAGIPFEMYEEPAEGVVHSVTHGRLFLERRPKLVLAKRTYTYSGGRNMSEWSDLTSGRFAHGGRGQESFGHIYRGREPAKDTVIDMSQEADEEKKESEITSIMHSLALKFGWKPAGNFYVKDGKVWSLEEIELALGSEDMDVEPEGEKKKNDEPIQGLVEVPATEPAARS